MVVAMYSHAQRETERQRTCKAFDAIGMPVSTVSVQSEPPGRVANRHNARKALASAAAISDGHVLLIEDDILPSPSLPAWAPALEAVGEVVSLYTVRADFVPADRRSGAVYEYQHVRSAIVRIERRAEWWGAQALVIPPDIVAGMLDDPAYSGPDELPGPHDYYVRDYLMRHKRALLISCPSLVQHQGARNLRAPRKYPHRSHFYREHAPPP